MTSRPSGGRDNRVCVAQIGAAHGLKGDVRLFSFTEDPLAVARYGPLETEDGARRVVIEGLRAGKDHFVARLAGVHDRDAAETLRNVKLYLPRANLPTIEEAETFYHADLIGLRVVTTAGAEIGALTAVHNFGAGDLLEITLAHGETAMLPFTDTVVPEIDLAGGKIVVDPPDGALTAKPRAGETGKVR